MNLVHEIITAPWFIEQEYADRHLFLVFQALKGETPPTASQPNNNNNFSLAFINNGEPYISHPPNDDILKDEKIEDPLLFILDCTGPITKYDQFCGLDGAKTKAQLLTHADNNPCVFAHLLNIDTGGGSGYAARLLSETIKNLKKPIFAFIDDFAASAGYWLAAATSHIAAGSTMARTGSIGTYISIHDYTEQLKKEGITVIDVYAKKSSDKNKDYKQAIKGDTALLEKLADEYNEFFLNHVRTERKEKLKSNDWETGKMYFAEEAIKLGLIDEISPFNEYIKNIFKEFAPK